MPLIRSISLPLVAQLTVAWGVLFAIVHFYWAAGGTALNYVGATDATTQAYIGLIAAIGLVSAAVAHGFVHSWGARLGRQRLTLLARAGGAALLLGVLIGVGRWLGNGGIGDDGVDGVVITAYFLLGGVLFSTLGWRRGPTPNPALRATAHDERGDNLRDRAPGAPVPRRASPRNPSQPDVPQ